MKRLLPCGVLLGLATALAAARPADADANSAKEALQGLQDFIGEWKGNGGPDKPKPSPTDPIWKETLTWSWKFKGDDAWLTVAFKEGKLYKSGDLRYLAAKKVYQFTLTDKDDKKAIFEGMLEKEILTLERTDPDSKETQQITMNTAAEGVRLIYRFAHKEDGKTLFKKDFLVQATRVGESLGAKESKNICVVSGGLGTMQVGFKGETYWVCCSGCAEAFKENPEKYIAEFKAKKAAGK
jgi:hypothetical protein